MFVLQGSTLRKRKMYEEFLSKVSILGKPVDCTVNNYFALNNTVLSVCVSLLNLTKRSIDSGS